MLQTKIETIDADMARKYLEHNMVNRHINHERVLAYKDELINGSWELNGESIKFNSDGEMIDGQHRLSAIIESGIPMTTVVTYGIDTEISSIDRGRPRSLRDSLIIGGMSTDIVSSASIAAAKLHYDIQRSKRLVSDISIKNFIEYYKDDLQKINVILSRRAHKKNKSIRNGVFCLAYLYALNVELSYSEIDTFSEIVQTGFYSNKSQSSAIVLRNDWLSGTLGTHNRLNRENMLYAIEKALSDFHAGYPRKVSYKAINTPTYSNNAKFRGIDSDELNKQEYQRQASKVRIDRRGETE